MARAVRSVVARRRRRLGVRCGVEVEVEVGDEDEDEDEDDDDGGEDEGLIFDRTVERWTVAKRGREILGRKRPHFGRWTCTSLLEGE